MSLLGLFSAGVALAANARAATPGEQTPPGFLQDVKLSGAVDLFHPVSLESERADDNKLSVRSAEISLFSPIDHAFEGVLNFAGHSENGEFEWAVHEAYVSTSRLIPRSRIKIGKFFLGVGRLNQLHQHDWPFPTAPKAQREFFAAGADRLTAEGAIDQGAEYAILLPLPFYLDVAIGAANGYYFGHSHGEGARPRTPTHYLRPTTFFSAGSGAGVLVGLNYVGRTDRAGERMTLLGLDVTFKAREGKLLKWLFQTETWHRSLDPEVAGGKSEIGTYAFLERGLDENWAVGLRLDAFSRLNRSFATTGDKQKNLDYAVVPTLAYRTSEFASLRAAYSHEVGTVQGEPDARDRRFELQFIYLLGAHPAHDF